MFLKISQNSQENTCSRVSILIKLQAWFGSFHDIDKDLYIFQIQMESGVETLGFLNENGAAAGVLEKYITSFLLIFFC